MQTRAISLLPALSHGTSRPAATGEPDVRRHARERKVDAHVREREGVDGQRGGHARVQLAERHLKVRDAIGGLGRRRALLVEAEDDALRHRPRCNPHDAINTMQSTTTQSTTTRFCVSLCTAQQDSLVRAPTTNLELNLEVHRNVDVDVLNVELEAHAGHGRELRVRELERLELDVGDRPHDLANDRNAERARLVGNRRVEDLGIQGASDLLRSLWYHPTSE